MRIIWSLAAAAVSIGPAFASDIVDQSNFRIQTPNVKNHGVGNTSRQEIAQSFTVGRTGRITKLRLPVSCGSGSLTVDIVRQGADGAPTGPLLNRTNLANVRRDNPTPPDFTDVPLGSPLNVTKGDKLAFVLSSATGACGVSFADAGDTYAAGKGFFRALPGSLTKWNLLDEAAPAGSPQDLAFETVQAEGCLKACKNPVTSP